MLFNTRENVKVATLIVSTTSKSAKHITIVIGTSSSFKIFTLRPIIVVINKCLQFHRKASENYGKTLEEDKFLIWRHFFNKSCLEVHWKIPTNKMFSSYGRLSMIYCERKSLVVSKTGQKILGKSSLFWK